MSDTRAVSDGICENVWHYAPSHEVPPECPGCGEEKWDGSHDDD